MKYSAKKKYDGVENDSIFSKFKRNWLYVMAMSLMFAVGTMVVIVVASNYDNLKPNNSEKINNPDGFQNNPMHDVFMR
jgi:hypothetical protein